MCGFSSDYGVKFIVCGLSSKYSVMFILALRLELVIAYQTAND